MKWLARTFIIVLVAAVISNALIHCDEILETRLNTAKIETNSFVIELGNNIVADILKIQHSMIAELYIKIFSLNTRIAELENKEETVNETEEHPDFEKLMNGTVTIYRAGYAVAGVCISEDDDYYYILTVQHLLRNREEDTAYPSNAVPESNMGMAIKLEAIALFLVTEDMQQTVYNGNILTTSVQSRSFTTVAGEFLYVNELLDLALMRVCKSIGIELEVLSFADELPQIGDNVYVIGHPLGRRYNLSKGIVSNLDYVFFMTVDALMTFGNSGGAVFNKSGKIIGICSRVPAYEIELPELEK
ncbi:MAG: serine protease [Candidatus Hodarchaeota archaeon]